MCLQLERAEEKVGKGEERENIFEGFCQQETKNEFPDREWRQKEIDDLLIVVVEVGSGANATIQYENHHQIPMMEKRRRGRRPNGKVK